MKKQPDFKMNVITNTVKSTCESEFCGEETGIVTERVVTCSPTCSPIKDDSVPTEEEVIIGFQSLFLYQNPVNNSSCARTDSVSAVDYYIKVINPENKGGYEIHCMTGVKYDRVGDLEKALQAAYPGARECKFQFGFIVPGHGYKGKQQLLLSDEDLQSP